MALLPNYMGNQLGIRISRYKVGTMSAPSSQRYRTRQVADKLKLLRFCASPRTIREMLARMVLKDRETFMVNYLHPLLKQKLLAMTDPHSPRSPKQRYVATPAGLKAIERK